MFSLFLGLSLSFVSAQMVKLGLQCWGIKPILDKYIFLIPWEVLTLAKPQDVLDHLWNARDKLVQILWVLLAPKIDVCRSEPA